MSNDTTTTGLSPGQRMISSCAGAMITALLVTPFDVVKTRLQAEQRLVENGKFFLFHNGLMDHVCPICAAGPNSTTICEHRGSKTTTLRAFATITKQEGLFSLWRGLPPTMVMAVPATMIYFTSYDILKHAIAPHFGQYHNITAPMASGIIARTAAVLVVSPLELIRTKMQAKERYSYRELTAVVRHAIKQNGVLSLWRGLTSTLLRDLPFSAFYWPGYEYFKVKFSRATNEKSYSSNFAAGAVSGMIVAAATTPFDVVKTRLQVDMGEIATENQKVPSTWSVIKNIRKLHGWQGLFTGITARVAKVAPACAIMIGSYEFFKDFFTKRDKLS